MDTFRLIMELLYFTSGVALAIIAAFGLRQLSIAKENNKTSLETAKMSAKREAYKISSEQCHNYYSNIIPSINNLYSAVEDKKIEFFKKSKAQILGKEVKVSVSSVRDLKKLDDVSDEFLDAVNKLEGFSIYFISRVADENVAFASVGHTFCSSVGNLLPYIILLSDGKYFRNVIELFLLWNSRIENNNLLLDKAKLDEQIAKINAKFIDPLGS